MKIFKKESKKREACIRLYAGTDEVVLNAKIAYGEWRHSSHHSRPWH
jgi:hypothetical protein